MSAPWWKTGVIYEIYPRSFKDANGDGVGDLRGIIAMLDYLNDGTPQSLGVDAIWITPFYPSPFFDFGYDVMDYCGIDPLFGTMEDFEELVREAHQRNIRIVIDLVYNHSSHLHPWFQESRKSKDNPKRDWYIWRDPAPNGKRPNNWQAVFGGSAWTWDAATEQYYLHSFLQEQPDLNWRNPEVQKALFDIICFWMEKGVDGFRLDVINLIFKDAEFPSNPACFGRRPYEMQRHIHDRNQPEAHTALKAMRSLVDRYGEKMLVGEINLDRDEDGTTAASFYGGANDELHLAFNFEFLECPWQASAFKAAVERWECSLPEGGWPNYVLSNHDYPRHYSRYAKGEETEARARLAALMLFTLRGTPFLYYGEEIGMRNVRVPRWRFQDPVGKRYWPFHPGRDEERTPMQWTGGEQAGFSTQNPWLPLPRDYTLRNVKAQEQDPDSLLNFYKKLIWLRKRTPTLLTGSYKTLSELPDDIFGYIREGEGERYLTLLNFTGSAKLVQLHGDLPKQGQIVISTVHRQETKIVLSSIQLAGNEGLLLKL